WQKSETDLRKCKSGILTGHYDIAGQGELEATTQGRPFHARDNRLLHVPYDAPCSRPRVVEARLRGPVHKLADVRTGSKGLAVPRDDDTTNVLVRIPAVELCC